MQEYKGVMIFGEMVEQKLSAITIELLGCARKLADELKEEVLCVLIGSCLGNLSQEAVVFGADKVHIADNQIFTDYQADFYTPVLEKIIKEVSPRVILFGQTDIGRDLAPRLAFRLRTVLSTDCLELSIEPETKKLLQTRSVYGGNARAIFTSELFPQMATVRQKTMPPLEPDAARKGEVISVQVNLSPDILRAKLIKIIKEEATGLKLEDAKVIICGGRGMGGPEGFRQLEELAKLLNGAVGATRPPCDNGWVPAIWQIGLTGKIVIPDIYIAVGVSGASQHLAGCSGAKIIIAINKDPDANIFKEASFGVVGNWKEVLPALIEKLKEILKGA